MQPDCKSVSDISTLRFLGVAKTLYIIKIIKHLCIYSKNDNFFKYGGEIMLKTNLQTIYEKCATYVSQKNNQQNWPNAT